MGNNILDSYRVSHYSPQWAFLPVEDGDMIRINAAYFYNLGARVEPLIDVETLEDDELYPALYFANGALRAALLSDVIPLRTCTASGWELVAEIGKIITKQNKNEELTKSDLYPVRNAARDFQTVLNAELQVMDIYYVSQKALYSTVDLIAHAEIIFPESVRAKVSNEAKAEIQQAGKCLAFDVGTAAGFHLLRATEDVIRQYLGLLAGTELPKKSRNWGVYIRELKKHGGDAKVVLALEQIKDMHRNPIMHPDVVLTIDEAIGLFGITQGVIVAMVVEIEKIKPEAEALPLDDEAEVPATAALPATGAN